MHHCGCNVANQSNNQINLYFSDVLVKTSGDVEAMANSEHVRLHFSYDPDEVYTAEAESESPSHSISMAGEVVAFEEGSRLKYIDAKQEDRARDNEKPQEPASEVPKVESPHDDHVATDRKRSQEEINSLLADKPPRRLSTLESTSYSSNQKIALTTEFAVMYVCLGLIVGGIGATVPALARNADVSTDGISWIFSTRAVGYILGATAGGQLFSDGRKCKGNVIVFLAYLLIAGSSAVLPMMDSLWSLCCVFAVVGYAAGVIDTGLNCMIVSHFSLLWCVASLIDLLFLFKVWVWPGRVNVPMQLMHFMFAVGAFVSPLLTSYSLEVFDNDVSPS